MAGSSSCPLPSSEATSSFSYQSEMEMESSKARHWSELDKSATSSNWSAETNYKYFAELQNNPQWSRFFIDTEGLEVGKKISHGAQADIYEARMGVYGEFDLVVKVMKGDTSLQEFQKQWPIGMLSARSNYKHLNVYDPPLITLHGTLLDDKRFRGKFAFVMRRRWGDLRLLIDRRMEGRYSRDGPFSIDQAIHLMLTIAEDMDILHTKYDIVHRDLKASNVLVWKVTNLDRHGDRYGEEMNYGDDENLKAVVADFESSRLVMGIALWKVPEIFEQLKHLPSTEVKFTTMSDVYSYGMTCYEILTGFIPFHPKFCTRDDVLSGRRPNLSSEVPWFLRNIIERCWHHDPEERPNFCEIRELLMNKQEIPNLLECKQSHSVCVVIDNESQGSTTIVQVEQWSHCVSLTLLQIMEELVLMDLSILRATTSFGIEKIIFYLKVTNREGGKVCDLNVVAYIERINIDTKWFLALRMKTRKIFHWHGRFAQKDVIKQTYVVEISMFDEPWFSKLLKVFSEVDLQAYKAESWDRNGCLQCAMLVQGKKGWCVNSLLEGLASSFVCCYIVFHNLVARDANIPLENFKRVLGAPFSPSSIDTCPFERALNNPSPKYVLLEEENILHHDAIDVLRRAGYCSRSSFIPQWIYTSWLSNRRHKPQHDEDSVKFKGLPLFFRISGGYVLSICLRRRALQWKPWKEQML